MFNLSSLTSFAAIGGILAIVTAGWTHVKTVFSHLSSVLIVRSETSPFIGAAVYDYLRRNWRLLPSNTLLYRHAWMRVDGSHDLKCVPFRTLNYRSAIFTRGFSFIVCSENGNGFNFWGIRGLFNSDDMIRDAVSQFKSATLGTRKESQFRVIDLMGQEKGFGAASFAKIGKGGNSIGEDSPSSTSDSYSVQPDLDLPLIYSRESLLNTETRDPFEHLFYESYVHRAIENAVAWYENEEWYAKRGLPWRLGWLLSGPGGTGKSVLGQAMAELLGVRLYRYFLSTMSDQELVEEWGNMTTPCVVLFEDFDNIFHGRENQTAHKTLSFDTILNVMSGVQTRSGIFIVVTTNHPEWIDPALGAIPDENAHGAQVSTRPGRLDVSLHLGFIGAENRRRMAERMLSDWPDLHAEALAVEGELTPSQFQEICRAKALTRISEEKRAKIVSIVPDSQSKAA